MTSRHLSLANLFSRLCETWWTRFAESKHQPVGKDRARTLDFGNSYGTRRFSKYVFLFSSQINLIVILDPEPISDRESPQFGCRKRKVFPTKLEMHGSLFRPVLRFQHRVFVEEWEAVCTLATLSAPIKILCDVWRGENKCQGWHQMIALGDFSVFQVSFQFPASNP